MHTTTSYRIRKPSMARALRRPSRPSPDVPSPRSPYRRRSIALAAALAALALAAMPSLAAAQSLNNVSITSAASGGYLVLDVANASTSAGAPVIQWYGNVFASNQRWNFVQLPDGNEHIVSQNSGMCLTTDGVPGDGVYQWFCNNGWQDEWHGTLKQAIDAHDESLKNPLTGLYLDVTHDFFFAGAQIITWYGNGTVGEAFAYNQLW
jgi:hypothetical protein